MIELRESDSGYNVDTLQLNGPRVAWNYRGPVTRKDKFLMRPYLTPIVCPTCGVTFKPKHGKAQYCSLPCVRHPNRKGSPSHHAQHPLFDRVFEKVEIDDSTGCWLWTGFIHHGHRYGVTCIDKKNVLAHRTVYEMWRGPIPEGLHLHHTCQVRHCVNPDHLMPVTPQEHQDCHRNDVCPIHNTLRYQRYGRMRCRECYNDYCRKRYWRLKEARLGGGNG